MSIKLHHDVTHKRRRHYKFTTCGLAVVLLLLLAVCLVTRLAAIGVL